MNPSDAKAQGSQLRRPIERHPKRPQLSTGTRRASSWRPVLPLPVGSGPQRGAVDLDVAAVVGSDASHRIRPAAAALEPVEERLFPDGAADCKADEAWHARGLLQPVVDHGRISAAAEDDTAGLPATAAQHQVTHLPAVVPGVQAFDLPDVGIDAVAPQIPDRVQDQARPDFAVEAVEVTANCV